MEVLRRNTDYALRAMLSLARHWQQGTVSSRIVARRENISYQLLRKLMHQLLKAGLVRSSSGQTGGFELGRSPVQISLLDIIVTIQGSVSLNKCLVDGYVCCRRRTCPVHKKLDEFQKQIDNFFAGTTLQDLIEKK